MEPSGTSTRLGQADIRDHISVPTSRDCHGVTGRSVQDRMAPPFENWKGVDAIDPPLPSFVPNPDPAAIEIPGLDTTASINDQIDQMDQLITIKLQVCQTDGRCVHT